jgi:tetraacyldisaccharide 4'-kinase
VVRGSLSESLMSTLRNAFTMTLEPVKLRNLHEVNRTLAFKSLKDKRVHAVAGIGNPQQFFDSLTRLGITHVPHAFPDHHAFKAADITFDDGDTVVMTEKDAVKCERFATNDHWALQTEARIHKSLLQRVVERMKAVAPR